MNSTEIENKANRLIDIKNEIAALKKIERELKSQLKPFISHEEQLILECGLLYGYSEKVVRTFNRKFVLEYLKERYGDEVADTVDAHCTIKKTTPQRLHVKLCKDKDS